jgi:hypothetical protein
MRPVYLAWISNNGDVVRTDVDAELRPERWSESGASNRYGKAHDFYGFSTVSAEHALKVAAERRQQWLREEGAGNGK